jgi:hypothetical protein
LEVSTSNNNSVSTSISSIVRYKFHDLRPVIVPKFNFIFRILLLVQRNWKRDWLFNDIWKRRDASDISRINEMSDNTFLSKVTSCVFIKVQKVFSPNLNECLTILGTISWIDWINSCLL